MEVISEEYQYGGTLDKVAVIDGVLSIMDFKSSSGIFPEHRIQIAAYGHSWSEMHPDRSIQGFHILQLDKDDGSFHHHFYRELDNAFKVFVCLRSIYDLKGVV